MRVRSGNPIWFKSKQFLDQLQQKWQLRWARLSGVSTNLAAEQIILAVCCSGLMMLMDHDGSRFEKMTSCVCVFRHGFDISTVAQWRAHLLIWSRHWEGFLALHGLQVTSATGKSFAYYICATSLSLWVEVGMGGTKQTSNYKAWVGRVKRQSKRQSCCTPLSQTITHPQRLRVPVDAKGAGLQNNPHQNVPKTVWATATVLWRAHLAASRVPLHILLAKSCKWATNQSHLFWVLKVQGEPQGRHGEFMMFARVFWSCDFAV
jgi:hypothetical protein